MKQRGIISLFHRFTFPKRICLRVIVSMKFYVENILWKRRKCEKERTEEREKTEEREREKESSISGFMYASCRLMIIPRSHDHELRVENSTLWGNVAQRQRTLLRPREPHSFMAHRHHYKVANPRFSRYDIDQHAAKAKSGVFELIILAHW